MQSDSYSQYQRIFGDILQYLGNVSTLHIKKSSCRSLVTVLTSRAGRQYALPSLKTLYLETPLYFHNFGPQLLYLCTQCVDVLEQALKTRRSTNNLVHSLILDQPFSPTTFTRLAATVDGCQLSEHEDDQCEGGKSEYSSNYESEGVTEATRQCYNFTVSYPSRT
jgi:hypothetical protein